MRDENNRDMNEDVSRIGIVVIETVHNHENDPSTVQPKERDTLGDKIERFFESNAYGIAAFTKEMEGVDFPITKEDLLRQAGDKDIQWFEDTNRVRLRDILVNLHQDRFDSMRDLLESVANDVSIRRG